jgi:hypothetical protein
MTMIPNGYQGDRRGRDYEGKWRPPQPQTERARSSWNHDPIPVPEVTITPSAPPTDKRPERAVRRYFGTTEYTEAEYAQHDAAEARKAQQKLIDADKRKADIVRARQAEQRALWKQEADADALKQRAEEQGKQAELGLVQQEIAGICQSYDLPASAVAGIARKLGKAGLEMLPSFWEQEAKQYTGGL